MNTRTWTISHVLLSVQGLLFGLVGFGGLSFFVKVQTFTKFRRVDMFVIEDILLVLP